MNYYQNRENQPHHLTTWARAPASASGRAHAHHRETAADRPSVPPGRQSQGGSPANRYQYEQPLGYYQSGCWYNARLQRQPPQAPPQSHPQQQQERPLNAAFTPQQQRQHQQQQQQQPPITASYGPQQQLPSYATQQQQQQLPSYSTQQEQQILLQSYQSQQILPQTQMVISQWYPSQPQQQQQYVLVPAYPSQYQQHQQQQFLLPPYQQQHQGQTLPQTYESQQIMSPSCSLHQLQQQQQQPTIPAQGQPRGQYREADTISWSSQASSQLTMEDGGGSSVYQEAQAMPEDTQNPTEAVLFNLAPGVLATRSRTKLTIDIDLSQVEEDAVPEARLNADEVMGELGHLIRTYAFRPQFPRRRRSCLCLPTAVSSPSPVSDGVVDAEVLSLMDSRSADIFESVEESTTSSLSVSVAEKDTQTFEIFHGDDGVSPADVFKSVPGSPASPLSVLMADKDTQTDEVFKPEEVFPRAKDALPDDEVSESSSRCLLVAETDNQTFEIRKSDEGEAAPSAEAPNDAQTFVILEADEKVTPSRQMDAPKSVQESPHSGQTKVKKELSGPLLASSLTPSKLQDSSFFVAFQPATASTPTQQDLLSEQSKPSATPLSVQEEHLCPQPASSATPSKLEEEHLSPPPRILLEEKHLSKKQPFALSNYLIGNRPSKGKKRTKARPQVTGLDTSNANKISPRREPKEEPKAPLPLPEPSETIGDSSAWPPLGSRAPTKASQVKKSMSNHAMTVFSNTWQQLNVNSASNTNLVAPKNSRPTSNEPTFQPKQILRREDSVKSKGVKCEAGAPKVQPSKAPQNRPLSSSANDKKIGNSRPRDMANGQADRKNSFQCHKQKQTTDSKLKPGNMFALLDQPGTELPSPATKAKAKAKAAAGKEADLAEVRKLAAIEAKKQKRYLKKKNAHALRLENKEKAVATKKEKSIAPAPERPAASPVIVCGDPERKKIGIQFMGEVKLASQPAIDRWDKPLKLLFFKKTAPEVGDAVAEANKPPAPGGDHHLTQSAGEMDELPYLGAGRKRYRSNFLDAVAEFAVTLRGTPPVEKELPTKRNLWEQRKQSKT